MFIIMCFLKFTQTVLIPLQIFSCANLSTSAWIHAQVHMYLLVKYKSIYILFFLTSYGTRTHEKPQPWRVKTAPARRIIGHAGREARVPTPNSQTLNGVSNPSVKAHVTFMQLNINFPHVLQLWDKFHPNSEESEIWAKTKTLNLLFSVGWISHVIASINL